MRTPGPRFFLSFLFATLLVAPSAGRAASDLVQRANALELKPGAKPPFLGVFTHVEPRADMAGKLATLRQIIADNPHVVGFTLKIHWRQLHPEPQRWDWDGLEALIATAHHAGKLINLGLIPGAASPEWIYAAGVKKAGPFEFGRIQAHTPLPWDARFMELYLADLTELGRRYANDPRIFQVQILGHNYNEAGEEMHAPSIESMKPHGWTRELVLQNWRYWIDRYAELFPKTKLSLIVSQMYRGGEHDLPDLVADYFVERCTGRAVLQTHQIHGRDATLPSSAKTCARLADRSASSHEAVGSFLEQRTRQGTAAMTVYNCRMAGDNLLYFQLWRRDCNDPKFARDFLDAWQKYGALPLADLKPALIRDGLFIEKSDYVPPSVPPTSGPHKSAAKGNDP
jgi:hypothetical protein